MDKLRKEKGIDTLINLDESAIFFDFQDKETLEIKGTKYVGLTSHTRAKNRLTILLIVSSNGDKLPPCIILKAAKPRNKSYNDNPLHDFPELNEETTEMVRRKQILVLHSYSEWVNSYLMRKHIVPHLSKHMGRIGIENKKC